MAEAGLEKERQLERQIEETKADLELASKKLQILKEKQKVKQEELNKLNVLQNDLEGATDQSPEASG